MRKLAIRFVAGLIIALIALIPFSPAAGRPFSLPAACRDLAFSTEEDFYTRGPAPPDGIAVISDGDLLGRGCVLCARNQALLAPFDVSVDLGLDAADVIDWETNLVAFSTELDSPTRSQFTAGDLLVTDGVIIPNLALLDPFTVTHDIGLDAVHFVGNVEQIIGFLDWIVENQLTRGYWVANPSVLRGQLLERQIDIWFSTEGTCPPVERPCFLDGDLLSAATGIIIASNRQLLPAAVPAGLPNDGVDFGLDAVTGNRAGHRDQVRFSTEILYGDTPSFTDGDVLKLGVGVETKHEILVGCFEPVADFLGLDALHMAITDLTRLRYLPPIFNEFN